MKQKLKLVFNWMKTGRKATYKLLQARTCYFRNIKKTQGLYTRHQNLPSSRHCLHLLVSSLHVTITYCFTVLVNEFLTRQHFIVIRFANNFYVDSV